MDSDGWVQWWSARSRIKWPIHVVSIAKFECREFVEMVKWVSLYFGI